MPDIEIELNEKRLTLRMTPEAHAKLKAQAALAQMTLNDYAVMILEQWKGQPQNDHAKSN